MRRKTNLHQPYTWSKSSFSYFVQFIMPQLTSSFFKSCLFKERVSERRAKKRVDSYQEIYFWIFVVKMQLTKKHNYSNDFVPYSECELIEKDKEKSVKEIRKKASITL